jgi:hypothetical protein
MTATPTGATTTTTTATTAPTTPDPGTGASALSPSALAWLRPVAAPAPEGVRPSDLGPLGFQVLLHDGVLRPVWGDLAAPAARPAGPALRAAAVRALVPPRAVLGRAGAVWVHTDGPVPDRFDVLVEPRVRRPSPHPARVPHECPLPPDDVVRLGDVRVTTVVRTALDVVRWLEPDEASRLLARLVAHAGLVPEAVLRAAARCADRRVEPRLRAVLAAQPCCAGTPAVLDPVIR